MISEVPCKFDEIFDLRENNLYVEEKGILIRIFNVSYLYIR